MKRVRYSRNEELFREMLKKHRLKAKIKQNDLAKKLNTSQPCISKYESGERLLSFVEAIDICNALNINIHEFIEEYLSNET